MKVDPVRTAWSDCLSGATVCRPRKRRVEKPLPSAVNLRLSMAYACGWAETSWLAKCIVPQGFDGFQDRHPKGYTGHSVDCDIPLVL